jgi:hypothetical protein
MREMGAIIVRIDRASLAVVLVAASILLDFNPLIIIRRSVFYRLAIE